MRTSILIFVSLVVLILVGTGCYPVEYTVEHKGDSCIKFEDAMYDQDPDEVEVDWVDACLGEDGVQEADGFLVELSGYTEDIKVSVKAGKCKVKDVALVWSLLEVEEDVFIDVLEANVCGFTIYALPDEGGCELLVVSDTDNRTAALSNITFCFGDGVEVLSPPEGPLTILRHSEDDEPTEPEEEEID